MTLTLLVSRLFSVFPDDKSKLYDVVIRLNEGGLIFDELFLRRMKGLVLLSSLRLYLVFPNQAYSDAYSAYFFGFQVTFE